MGFLSGLLGTVGKVASGLTGVNTIVNAASSLFGGGSSKQSAKQAEAQAQQQYQYQRLLNEQQQEYARENASTEYERQRALTRDSASLGQEGRVQAGINTALGDGTTQGAASVNSIAAPSAGSAPDPGAHIAELENAQNNGMVSYISMLKQLNEARGQEIQNDFDQVSFESRLDKAVSDGEISRAQAHRMKRDNRVADEDYEQEIQRNKEATEQAIQATESARLDNEIKRGQIAIQEITKQLNEQELKKAQFIVDHMLEQYERDVREQLSRIDLNKASAANQRASVKAALAQAALSSEQSLLVHTQNELEKAKVPYASKLAKESVNLVKQQVLKTANEATSIGLSNEVVRVENGWSKKSPKEVNQVYQITKFLGDNLRNLNSFRGLFTFGK